ncbi:MAG TPA: hypothetical protein VFD84_06230 [Candidatus Binatia bacterium]|jgi:hypothetical protein|nr:hypothetical protein [Candidatus Binatia bacterium]
MILDLTHLLAPFFWGLVAVLVLGAAAIAAGALRESHSAPRDRVRPRA